VDNEKPIDANLLRRMMLGDFSATDAKSTAPKNVKYKSNLPKRKVELDLHFESLHPTKGKLSAGEKLNLQLEELNHFITDARKDGVTSAYIIVGKGEGILRNAVKKKLENYKISYAEIADPPYFGNALKIRF
jgi:dsDNA-specific endonuclease/ATPase MutS2